MTVTNRRTTLITLEEARARLKRPITLEEVVQRRAALKNSDRYLEEMDPNIGVDIKDWIRRERGTRTGD